MRSVQLNWLSCFFLRLSTFSFFFMVPLHLLFVFRVLCATLSVCVCACASSKFTVTRIAFTFSPLSYSSSFLSCFRACDEIPSSSHTVTYLKNMTQKGFHLLAGGNVHIHTRTHTCVVTFPTPTPLLFCHRH